MRSMPKPVSRSSPTKDFSSGCQKLGQPVPESNLVRESNSGVSQPTQKYTPSAWLSQYSLRNGGSVPCWRATRYCSDVRRARHSESVRFTAALLMSMTTLEGRPQADFWSPGGQYAASEESIEGFWELMVAAGRVDAAKTATAAEVRSVNRIFMARKLAVGSNFATSGDERRIARVYSRAGTSNTQPPLSVILSRAKDPREMADVSHPLGSFARLRMTTVLDVKRRTFNLNPPPA